MGWRCLAFIVCMGLRLTWREPGLCSVVIKAECNPSVWTVTNDDYLYFVTINRSGSLLFSMEVFDFVHKTSSALRNSRASVFQGSNYTAVIGNATRPYAKRPKTRCPHFRGSDYRRTTVNMPSPYQLAASRMRSSPTVCTLVLSST